MKKEMQAETEKGEIKGERGRGCFLSPQEGMEQECVAEKDRATTETKASTVDNFLI